MATECKLTEREFKQYAKPITTKIAGAEVTFEPCVFNKSKDAEHPSFGWAFNGKINLPVNGSTHVVQASINLPLVGSKKVARE